MKKPTQPKKRRDQVIYLRLENTALELIDRVAAEQNRSRSAQIAFILKQHLQSVAA